MRIFHVIMSEKQRLLKFVILRSIGMFIRGGAHSNEQTKQTPKQQDKKIINVSVDLLRECIGVVSGDVVGKNGEIILPSGVDLSVIEDSIDSLIVKMKKHNIRSVPVSAPHKLTEREIESIVDNVYSENDQLISKDKARTIIKNIDTLFQMTNQDDKIPPEIITSIYNMSDDLTVDLMSNSSAILSLAKVREADEYTFVHSFNVSVLTGFLGSRLYPNNKDIVHTLVLGGLLHDIGKAHIPPEILQKPGRLTPEEFEVMQRHPELGVMLAVRSGITDDKVISIIGGHHEKFNGNGYPAGQRGASIPEVARVTAVADVFDALTATRVYKGPMSSKDAVNIIMSDTGKFFDPAVSREMLLIIGLYPPGSLVSLSDGRVGVVVSGGGRDLVRPLVMLRNSGKADGNSPPVFINLKETGIHIAKYLGHSGKRSLED